MKEIYSEFDLFELEDDIRAIFTKVYEECLNKNADYIGYVTAHEARGYFESTLKTWEEMEVEPYYKRIWHIEAIDFVSRQGLP